MQIWTQMITNPPQFVCFLVLSTKFSDLIFEQEWNFLPNKWWAIATTLQIMKGLAYLDHFNGLFFLVRETGEGFTQKYGFSIDINCLNQSARSQSGFVVWARISGFSLRRSMADGRYNLSAFPELGSMVKYDVWGLRCGVVLDVYLWCQCSV